MATRKIPNYSYALFAVLTISSLLENCLGQIISVTAIPPSALGWTLSSTATQQCGASSKCFFIGAEVDCQADDPSQCPILISIEADLANQGMFTFRLVSPIRQSGSHYVAVGLKRTEDDNGVPIVDNSHTMNNTVMMACARYRLSGMSQYFLMYGIGVPFNVARIPNENAQQTDHLRDVKISEIDGRLHCEFKRPIDTNVSLANGRSVRLKLDSNVFLVLVASGPVAGRGTVLWFSNHSPHFRSVSPPLSLKQTECGTTKSCVGWGLDGCLLISQDCFVWYQAEPFVPGVTGLNTTALATHPDMRIKYQLHGLGGNVLFLSFCHEEATGQRRALEAVDACGLSISCEWPLNALTAPEIVMRFNGCHGVPTLNPFGCSAVLMNDTIWDIEKRLSNVTFSPEGPGRFRCDFIFDPSGNMTFGNENFTVALGANATEYYTMMAVADTSLPYIEPGTVGGKLTTALPLLAGVGFVATRLPALIGDNSVLDFQILIPSTPKDERSPGSINPKDPNAAMHIGSDNIKLGILCTNLIAFAAIIFTNLANLS